jgi:hypothetical protein
MNASAAEIIPEAVPDVLDQLVVEFVDPLSFVRELIQNAMDAGSAEVDVSCTFEERGSAESPELGVAVIRIADYGEGMDRHIIDTRLTRLLSSDKADDRTKIGKFGIGFISVFALRPDAVSVDTGRSGERWRVLFRPDRSFTRVYLSEPVEGTTVRLWKAMTRSEFVELQAHVREALQQNCQHIEIELRYQGEALPHARLSNAVCAVEALEAPIKVAACEEDAVIVVGYTPDNGTDTASFYNRGLTLLCRPSEFAGISYKINSPGLAHTLSRDNVIKDEHYQGLIAAVRRLAAGPLAARRAALEH